MEIRKHKLITFLFLLSVTPIFSQQYPDYSISWPWQDWVETGSGGTPSGGGSNVTFTISEGTLTVRFNAGFQNAYMKTDHFELTGMMYILPNVTLGSLNGGYQVRIINNSLQAFGPPTQITNFGNKTFTLVLGDIPPIDAPATNPVPGKNTIVVKNYNENQELIGNSVQIYDDAGRMLQQQVLSQAARQYLVSEPLYDEYERPVGQTLPAPVGGTVNYVENFATVSATQLTASNWKSSSPPALDHSVQGTLGHYYSSANPEPVAETGLPYAVSDFYGDGSGEQKTASKPGDQHYLASQNNALQKVLPVTDFVKELRYYDELRTLVTGQSGILNRVVKQVIIDANGNEAISYTDDSGNTIATAISGGDPWEAQHAISWTNNENGVDIHVSKGASVSLSSYQSIYDLVTNAPLGTNGILSQGFYRLTKASGEGSIRPTYTNHAYQIYDNKGRLVASVTPRGVVAISSRGGTGGLTRQLLVDEFFTTLYTYDFQGRLLSMEEPDAGLTTYRYRKDGQIRYSQNAEQELTGKYSYTNYDDLGRPTESGECVNCSVAYSAASLTANVNDANIADWIKTYYDVATLPISGDPEFADFNAEFPSLTQDFMQGAVSSTESEAVRSWYSYDDQGRVTWLLQHVKDLAKYFLIEYSYDFLGNVTKVAFQPQTHCSSGCVPDHVNEAFWHRYTYDKDQRLISVETSIDHSDWYLQATYEYYVHGPLKRIELAEDLQGIDYTYTPQGWLKAVNHPIPEFDPGGDDGTAVQRDIFGMTLEYHDEDYQNGGLNFDLLNTNDGQFPDQYNGNVKAMVYGAADQGEYALKHHDATVELDTYQDPVAKAKDAIVLQPGFDTQGNPFTTELTDELTVELLDDDNVQAYAYQYDEKYQLIQAKHGYAKTHASADNAYDVNIDGYDENGNIEGIERYSYDAGTPRDDLGFTYYPNSNRLQNVSNYINNILYSETGQVKEITYHPSTGRQDIRVRYDVTGKVTAVLDTNDEPIMEVVYDDRGFRIMKRAGTLEYWYIRDASGQVMAIYCKEKGIGNPLAQIELPIYGSGKLGIAYKNPDHYKYIYELTDHLGSVRAIITKLGLMATATMEVDTKPNGIDEYEEQYFDNLDGSRHLDAANTHSGSHMAWTYPEREDPGNPGVMLPAVAIGPTVTLRVQEGDQLNLNVFTKYSTAGLNPSALTSGIADALEGSVNDVVVGVEGGILSGAVASNIASILGGVTNISSDQPRAYMQYILFDEQFNVVGGNYLPVEDGVDDPQQPAWSELALSDAVTEDGYLFAYLVNESNVDVYWDDFTFELIGVRAIRKTDYYPFGAVAKQWNNPDQTQREKYRYDYQGQFAEKDEETGWNAFESRQYDPLIGRWLQVDPAREFYSPYLANANNPLLFIDPDGEDVILFNFIDARAAVQGATGNLVFSIAYDTHTGDVALLFGGGVGGSLSVGGAGSLGASATWFPLASSINEILDFGVTTGLMTPVGSGEINYAWGIAEGKLTMSPGFTFSPPFAGVTTGVAAYADVNWTFELAKFGSIQDIYIELLNYYSDEEINNIFNTIGETYDSFQKSMEGWPIELPELVPDDN